MGFINTPQLPIGNVEAVTSAGSSKVVSFVKRIGFDQTGDVSMTPGPDTTDISNTSELDVEVSANVSSAKLAAIKAQATSQVTSNVQLTIGNSERQELTDPAAVLNKVANQADLIKTLKENPNTEYILIYGGVSTLSVKFSLKTGTQNSLSFSFGSDSFSGSVNYSCQGNLDQTVSQANQNKLLVFFKAVKIALTPDGNALTTQPVLENLGDYDWTHALM
jgi:hypothetical protein